MIKKVTMSYKKIKKTKKIMTEFCHKIHALNLESPGIPKEVIKILIKNMNLCFDDIDRIEIMINNSPDSDHVSIVNYMNIVHKKSLPMISKIYDLIMEYELFLFLKNNSRKYITMGDSETEYSTASVRSSLGCPSPTYQYNVTSYAPWTDSDNDSDQDNKRSWSESEYSDGPTHNTIGTMTEPWSVHGSSTGSSTTGSSTTGSSTTGSSTTGSSTTGSSTTGSSTGSSTTGSSTTGSSTGSSTDCLGSSISSSSDTLIDVMSSGFSSPGSVCPGSDEGLTFKNENQIPEYLITESDYEIPMKRARSD
ncbi:hypothetical protein AL387_gp190 [Salmon gill poxvirus]|uniref:Uncharacterized protein n=1 Tax=Salmon gill poxvirus TaxID=1680908 RepID=A0A0H4YFS5_9POXV|nr:hypothetical protein AL387_gp190 [Salmon gill poxvirus]AKR04314.1 hypothetical protein SGPV190 [Salmon gill poxvirus]